MATDDEHKQRFLRPIDNGDLGALDKVVRVALRASVRGKEPAARAREALLRAAVDRPQAVQAEGRSGLWRDRGAPPCLIEACLLRAGIAL